MAILMELNIRLTLLVVETTSGQNGMASMTIYIFICIYNYKIYLSITLRHLIDGGSTYVGHKLACFGVLFTIICFDAGCLNFPLVILKM
jgi:hypothetical protein